MKYRCFSMLIALMLLCSLLSGCSRNANSEDAAISDSAISDVTATGEHEALVTAVNQTRIDYMRSQLNADDELIERMNFTYYVPKEESSDSSFSTETYSSSLGESILIRSENGQIQNIWYITPLCPPLPRYSDSKDAARLLGLSNAVTISEVLFGGSVESGNAATTQLFEELHRNTEGEIKTENMRIAFHGYIGNIYATTRNDMRWHYEFMQK